LPFLSLNLLACLPAASEPSDCSKSYDNPQFSRSQDLGDNPFVSLDIPFDSVRLYITQVALDEMANEAGIRRAKGLYSPNFGARDLVMFGLAQALAGAMEQPGDGTAMFSDCIALAFFAHIVRAYGSVPIGGPIARGGLAAWRLQRARDFINVNLAHDPSIAQIAHECGLSRTSMSAECRDKQFERLSVGCG
jgi:AraC family transcriptional regulator